jgi:hypothetical protein
VGDTSLGHDITNALNDMLLDNLRMRKRLNDLGMAVLTRKEGTKALNVCTRFLGEEMDDDVPSLGDDNVNVQNIHKGISKKQQMDAEAAMAQLSTAKDFQQKLAEHLELVRNTGRLQRLRHGAVLYIINNESRKRLRQWVKLSPDGFSLRHGDADKKRSTAEISFDGAKRMTIGNTSSLKIDAGYRCFSILFEDGYVPSAQGHLRPLCQQPHVPYAPLCLPCTLLMPSYDPLGLRTPSLSKPSRRLYFCPAFLTPCPSVSTAFLGRFYLSIYSHTVDLAIPDQGDPYKGASVNDWYMGLQSILRDSPLFAQNHTQLTQGK